MSKYTASNMWMGGGIYLSKGPGENKSVGIDKNILRDVIDQLTQNSGFWEMHELSVNAKPNGITMKDHQGRNLFIPKNEIAEVIQILRHHLHS